MKTNILFILVLFFTQIQAQVTSTVNGVITQQQKIFSSSNVQSLQRVGTQTEILKILLYYTDNGGVLRNADGATAVFNNNYSNAIDANDAQQMANWDEDIAIKRDDYYLSIESRKLADANDSVPLAIANLKTQAYIWKFVPKNFNATGLMLQLHDRFTNTYANISFTDTTVITFNATANAASKAENRFVIVFKINESLPVTVTNFKASSKNKGISLEWNADNEINIEKYEIERSNNAIQFSVLGSIEAIKAKSYQYFDATPMTGYAYYRIRIIEKFGNSYYSPTIKTSLFDALPQVNIFPNPLVGTELKIELKNSNNLKYTVSVIDQLGKTVYLNTISFTTNSSIQSISFNKSYLPSGVYKLILQNTTSKMVKSFIVQ